MRRVSAHLEYGHMQWGIAKLNLESGDRLVTLIKVLKRDWNKGLARIWSKSSPKSVTGDSLSAHARSS